jgi:dihydroneopterin triphosphate diphosphatase
MDIISGYIEVHVFRRTGTEIEYLMLKRGDSVIYPGLWQIVTGKIKQGEKAYETALREVKEETGFIPLNLWAAPKINQFYSAEKDSVYIVPVFAAEVLFGPDAVICDEHCEFKWMNPEDAKNILPWEEQRIAVDIVHNYVLKMPGFLNLVKIEI